MAAKILPNFNPNIKLETNHDIELLDVHFDYSDGGRMIGSLRNTTDRTIHDAEVVFDLADAEQSGLGAVTLKETDLAPGATIKFDEPINQKGAAFAVVREVHTR